MTALPCQQGVKSNQLVTTAKANRKKKDVWRHNPISVKTSKTG